MAAVLLSVPARTFPDCAFASLFDLALLRLARTHVEICPACSTLNRGSARQCKCCQRKLPAFHAGARLAGAAG